MHYALVDTLTDGNAKIIQRLNLLKVATTYTKKFLLFAESNRMLRKDKSNIVLQKKTISLAKDVIVYLKEQETAEPWALVYGKDEQYRASCFPNMIIKKYTK